jgi:RimJ/RimL family protein N-acetyltransferase
MGYGYAALIELERILKKRSIQSVELHVFEYNNAAINLYKKCGFVIAKSDNGSIYMEKAL